MTIGRLQATWVTSLTMILIMLIPVAQQRKYCPIGAVFSLGLTTNCFLVLSMI